MTSLLDDFHTSAQWIARALDTSGYKADFTPEVSETSSGS